MTQDRTRAIVEAAQLLASAVVSLKHEEPEFDALHGDTCSAYFHMLEAHADLEAALSLPAPQWTRTPPSEPGFYFARQWNQPVGGSFGDGTPRSLVRSILEVRVVEGQMLVATPFGYRTVEQLAAIDNGMEVEWFPVRIEEPPA